MRSFHLTGLAATVLLAAACDSSLTAPAATDLPGQASAVAAQPERIVEEHVYDLDGVQIVGWCGDEQVGEFVELTGRIYETITLARVPGGLERISIKSKPVGVSGTGVESGDRYQIVSQDQYVGRSNAEGQSGSYSYRMTFRNLVTNVSFSVTTIGNYRLDEDENIIVEHERVRSSCEGPLVE